MAGVVDSSTGQPPLHVATRLGAVAALRALVAGGAKLEDKDAHGRTALTVRPTAAALNPKKALNPRPSTHLTLFHILNISILIPPNALLYFLSV